MDTHPGRFPARLAALLLAALLLAAALAAGAQAAPAAAPPPPAPSSPFAHLRPLSQIPAAKLATLRQLADLTVNYSSARQSFLANTPAIDKALLAGLQQKGLSAARAQEFVAAFNQQFATRLTAALTNDSLVPLLDAAYNDDQAAQLLAFYRTPLGQRVAHLQPLIITAGVSQIEQSLRQVSALAAHDVSGSFPELNADVAAAKPGALPRPTAVKSLYPPVGEAQADLAAAEQRAAARRQRVLVVFGGNWCYDCHVLDAAFHSPAYAPLIAPYQIVNVNIGDMGKDNLDLAQKLGVQLDQGVPALAVLDPHGAVLVAQKQGEFQDTRALPGAALATFLKAWAPR
ncbi:MAG TPA: thioredoxin family protein [Terriglobales bacterium]|nr:thioredoxin family protein [Terriglobales bacterium]